MFPKQTYPTTNNHSFSVIKIDSACIDNKHETTSTKIFKGIVEVKIAADRITQIELNLFLTRKNPNHEMLKLERNSTQLTVSSDMYAKIVEKAKEGLIQ
ncbi:hypothetical protein [Brucella gallinifaecis]|uniref:hypothetical protein n=1 Tax=Brucella gallinifaecis TaxID=215590 RepID=UPI0023628033|nr:hypothetical protein [Brucella gallinifaecis]